MRCVDFNSSHVVCIDFNKPWARHSHWMCRFQHLACVDSNKPWAGNSQNTTCSLQLTVCHCITYYQPCGFILLLMCTIIQAVILEYTVGQHGSVVKSDSTHTGSPGSIPSVHEHKWWLVPATRPDRCSKGSTESPCAISPYRRSFKISKFNSLLDVLSKVYYISIYTPDLL